MSAMIDGQKVCLCFHIGNKLKILPVRSVSQNIRIFHEWKIYVEFHQKFLIVETKTNRRQIIHRTPNIERQFRNQVTQSVHVLFVFAIQQFDCLICAIISKFLKITSWGTHGKSWAESMYHVLPTLGFSINICRASAGKESTLIDISSLQPVRCNVC